MAPLTGPNHIYMLLTCCALRMHLGSIAASYYYSSFGALDWHFDRALQRWTLHRERLGETGTARPRQPPPTPQEAPLQR